MSIHVPKYQILTTPRHLQLCISSFLAHPYITKQLLSCKHQTLDRARANESASSECILDSFVTITQSALLQHGKYCKLRKGMCSLHWSTNYYHSSCLELIIEFIITINWKSLPIRYPLVMLELCSKFSFCLLAYFNLQFSDLLKSAKQEQARKVRALCCNS